MKKLKIVVVIVFAFIIGFILGSMRTDEIYIDMPSYGWWLAGLTEDGYVMYECRNIKIKTLQKIEEESEVTE